MTFCVSPDCHRLGLRAGAIVFRGVKIAESGRELRAEVAEEVRRVRSCYAGMAEVRSLPQLRRLYEIFRSVGAKPRKLPPSTEKLLHFALKRGTLPAINNLVDAYNLISVRTGFSLGAHDLDLLALPVALRLLRGDETFTPLGASAPQAVVPGEFAYVDGNCRVLCRLDVLQADFSRVTPETRNALLIIEGTDAQGPDKAREAFEECLDLVGRHCGGVAEIVCAPYGDR